MRFVESLIGVAVTGMVATGSVSLGSPEAGITPAFGADAVVEFEPGSGAGFGADYFPENVLGLPDTNARPGGASTDPAQILSLGLDGSIVLAFERITVVDGPGADFTVFENAFRYRLGGNDRIYAEPAEISVSADGVIWHTFPWDSTTLHGAAGVTPTDGSAPPDDPDVSGGDSFDIGDLGLQSVRYVRIRDITRVVRSNPEHPFWDPTLNGFDLDAVVAVHYDAGASSVGRVRQPHGLDLE